MVACDVDAYLWTFILRVPYTINQHLLLGKDSCTPVEATSIGMSFEVNFPLL